MNVHIGHFILLVIQQRVFNLLLVLVRHSHCQCFVYSSQTYHWLTIGAPRAVMINGVVTIPAKAKPVTIIQAATGGVAVVVAAQVATQDQHEYHQQQVYGDPVNNNNLKMPPRNQLVYLTTTTDHKDKDINHDDIDRRHISAAHNLNHAHAHVDGDHARVHNNDANANVNTDAHCNNDAQHIMSRDIVPTNELKCQPPLHHAGAGVGAQIVTLTGVTVAGSALQQQQIYQERISHAPHSSTRSAPSHHQHQLQYGIVDDKHNNDRDTDTTGTSNGTPNDNDNGNGNAGNIINDNIQKLWPSPQSHQPLATTFDGIAASIAPSPLASLVAALPLSHTPMPSPTTSHHFGMVPSTTVRTSIVTVPRPSFSK
jgi:hypothetical protein